MNVVPASHLGEASGAFNSVRQLGGVLGIAVLSAVFAASEPERVVASVG